MNRVEIIALEGIGEIHAGESIGQRIADAVMRSGLSVAAGDVVVVAHKIVSKAEGRIVALAGVQPSERALKLARELNKDPRVMELILQETRRVIRMGRNVFIVETHHGFVCANAGVDLSNAGPGKAILLPKDPDRSAASIREEIRQLCGLAPGVIVSDSFGRPWRLGITDVALGVAGLRPLIDYRGQKDPYGHELRASVTAWADEVAGAAELVMGKSSRIPAVLVRGLENRAGTGCGRELIRPEAEDLFRQF